MSTFVRFVRGPAILAVYAYESVFVCRVTAEKKNTHTHDLCVHFGHSTVHTAKSHRQFVAWLRDSTVTRGERVNEITPFVYVTRHKFLLVYCGIIHTQPTA